MDNMKYKLNRKLRVPVLNYKGGYVDLIKGDELSVEGSVVYIEPGHIRTHLTIKFIEINSHFFIKLQ